MSTSNVTLLEALELGTAEMPLRVDLERVRLVSASDYWDGPLSGLAELDGKAVWFHFADEENEDDDDDSWYRRFFLVDLPPQRLAAAHALQAAFQRHVGTHFDYDGSDHERDPSRVRPQAEWRKFYEAHPNETADSYVDCRVVGWFEL